VKKNIHVATRVHTRDQQRIPIVDQSSQARHVTFEYVEAEVEEYVAITKNEIKLMLKSREAIKNQK